MRLLYEVTISHHRLLLLHFVLVCNICKIVMPSNSLQQFLCTNRSMLISNVLESGQVSKCCPVAAKFLDRDGVSDNLLWGLGERLRKDAREQSNVHSVQALARLCLLWWHLKPDESFEGRPYSKLQIFLLTGDKTAGPLDISQAFEGFSSTCCMRWWSHSRTCLSRFEASEHRLEEWI